MQFSLRLGTSLFVGDLYAWDAVSVLNVSLTELSQIMEQTCQFKNMKGYLRKYDNVAR